MSNEKIDRRTMLAAAGGAAIGGVMTSAAGAAGGPPMPKAPPNPGVKKPATTLLLDDSTRAGLLKGLEPGKVKLPVKAPPGLTVEDVQKFVRRTGVKPLGAPPVPTDPVVEAMIRPQVRPILFVQNGTFQTAQLTIPEVKKWVEAARPRLEAAIPAVGRIDLIEHWNYRWCGTGWLVAKDIVVTNRHVASIFAYQDGAEYAFYPGILGKPVQALLDTLEEFTGGGLTRQQPYKLEKVLHIEPPNGFDLALLKVNPVADTPAKEPLPEPLKLFNRNPAVGQSVAVIGYPGYDPQSPDPDTMNNLFAGIYSVKRLAPGTITASDDTQLYHDATTLGGNSGSAVVDMDTGAVVGLHWGGTYMVANYAVPAKVIAERLAPFVKN